VYRGRKTVKRNIIVLALGAMLFALGLSAGAQQPGKIFRIGILDPSTASGSAVLWEAFGQELSKLGWNEGKNITIEYSLPSKRGSGYPSSRRSWFVLKSI
jgi:hypothetical protein